MSGQEVLRLTEGSSSGGCRVHFCLDMLNLSCLMDSKLETLSRQWLFREIKGGGGHRQVSASTWHFSPWDKNGQQAEGEGGPVTALRHS